MKTVLMLMLIPQSATHQFNADASVKAKPITKRSKIIKPNISGLFESVVNQRSYVSIAQSDHLTNQLNNSSQHEELILFSKLYLKN